MKPVDLSPMLEKFKGLWVALTEHDTVISANKQAKKAYDKAVKKGHKEPIMFKVPLHDLPHNGSHLMAHIFEIQFNRAKKKFHLI